MIVAPAEEAGALDPAPSPDPAEEPPAPVLLHPPVASNARAATPATPQRTGRVAGPAPRLVPDRRADRTPRMFDILCRRGLAAC
ncbi:hypothetical protein Shyhy01_26370 [Streptomyces hygroscopicus subsp. hygroscopicus]|nr:hypothetical protein Shyhy01_26370 [Streptomyces hygroscopicus subsp. hygroscopicus]